MGKRTIDKVEKILARIKCLKGDVLLLALSVVYLGPIEIESRMNIRKELAERILLEANQETSQCWSNSENE
jgi:hypothetical protein